MLAYRNSWRDLAAGPRISREMLKLEQELSRSQPGFGEAGPRQQPAIATAVAGLPITASGIEWSSIRVEACCLAGCGCLFRPVTGSHWSGAGLRRCVRPIVVAALFCGHGLRTFGARDLQGHASGRVHAVHRQ